MSDYTVTSDNALLVVGEAGGGKSSSLLHLDQPSTAYLSFEGNKRLPYKHNFKFIRIKNILDTYNYIQKAIDSPAITTIVLDTISAMMDMYETQVIVNSADSRAAWGDYAQFWRTLVYTYFAQTNKNIICLGHQKIITLDNGTNVKRVPVKGSLAGAGLEMYFTLITLATKVPISVFSEQNDDGSFKYKNDLLTLTEREKGMGTKYVYQTLPTSNDQLTPIRSLEQPGHYMWDINETYIDNNVMHYIQRTNEYLGT